MPNLRTALDWTVDRIGNGDPAMTGLMFIVLIAAGHVGHVLIKLVKEQRSRRKP